MITGHHGTTDTRADGRTTSSDPLSACPTQLHGDKSLRPQPDRVDEMHHIRLEVAYRAEELWSQEVELETRVDYQWDTGSAYEWVGRVVTHASSRTQQHTAVAFAF